MKKIIYSFLLAMTIMACSKDDEFTNIKDNNSLLSTIQNDTNFISSQEIEILGESIFTGKFEDNLFNTNTSNESSISSITPVGSDMNHASYYILNYKNNSFIILSADKRTFPVLAYSDKNTFDFNSQVYPDLLVNWLKTTDEYISKIRSGENNVTYNTPKNNWTSEEIQEYLTSKSTTNKTMNVTNTYTEPSCGQIAVGDGVLLYSYGPLLTTEWGQGEGYNNSSPDYSCSEYDNGKAPTGCVATSIAQIMNYHNYPNNYNWSIMPNKVYSSTVNSSGTNEIATLMRAIGNATGMDYGCDGSGTNTGNGVSALINEFGYSSANYSNFSFSTLETEISSGYPVILRGGEKVTKWLIFNTYQNGHAWVCDGIRKNKVAIERIVGRGYKIKQCVYPIQYHINWGWNGSYNGWFSSFSVSDYDFTYESKMLYNIRT